MVKVSCGLVKWRGGRLCQQWWSVSDVTAEEVKEFSS
jgi:hypothetical protein